MCAAPVPLSRCVRGIVHLEGCMSSLTPMEKLERRKRMLQRRIIRRSYRIISKQLAQIVSRR